MNQEAEAGIFAVSAAAASGGAAAAGALGPQPVREPIATTLLRTGLIALVIGGLIAALSGAMRRWPVYSLLVLWFSLGGHYVEVFFLNVLRPRLAQTRSLQVTMRLVTWFIGGMVLTIGMKLTADAVGQPWLSRRLLVSLGGIAFIGIELMVHAALQLRGRRSFYNGRG